MPNPTEGGPATGDSKKEAGHRLPSSNDAARENNPETVTDSHPEFLRSHSLWARTKRIADLVGPFVIVGGFILGAFGGLDFLIERKLSSPIILRRIASEAHPMVIFEVSSNGIASITKDAGAGRFIKHHQISVVKVQAPQQIRIDFVECLEFPPVLTSVYDSTIIVPSRAGGCAWKFDIHPVVSGVYDFVKVFRLELIW